MLRDRKQQPPLEKETPINARPPRLQRRGRASLRPVAADRLFGVEASVPPFLFEGFVAAAGFLLSLNGLPFPPLSLLNDPLTIVSRG